MDSRFFSVSQRFGRTVDVLRNSAAQCRHAGIPALPGHGFDRLKIAFGGKRESGLDHIYAEPLQLACERDLFLDIHRTSWRLLAVAEGRVKDGNIASGHNSPANCELIEQKPLPEKMV